MNTKSKRRNLTRWMQNRLRRLHYKNARARIAGKLPTYQQEVREDELRTALEATP